MRCAVFGCSVNNNLKSIGPNVQFFRFPKEEPTRSVWVNCCSRADCFNVENSRICSTHFTDDDYVRNLKHELLNYNPKNCRQLKESAVPSINIMKAKTLPSECNKFRQQRREARERKKIVDSVVNSSFTHAVNTVSSDGGGTHNNHPALPGSSPDADALEGDGNNNKLVDTCVSKGVNTEYDDRDTKIADLKAQLAVMEKEQNQLKKLFSPQQIRKIQTPNKRLTWSAEDISKAIAIHAAGPKAYRLMLKRGFPFPAVSTLRSWLKKILISPGILKKIFHIIKTSDMTKMDKVCVLSFDEMKIKKQFLYDKVNDETIKPFSYVQVIMLRGLFKSWKQPIFFDFDCKLTKDKIFDVINYVESAGFHVVAMTSDLGGGNRALHSEIGINTSKTWFLNPANDEKIFVFADVPHLIKLIRNHFVDQGFILEGQEVNKNIIEELIDLTSCSDLKITHKINKEMLNVKGAARQKVKFATKLFSHTIATAISRCGMLGRFKSSTNWAQCSEFFKTVNDWFDVLNVRVPETDSRARTKAYGLALNEQNIILDKMSDTVLSMKISNKKQLLPFQKGILITNTSLKLLFHEMQNKFNIKYLLTYRLNQDVLENFFGVIRAKGGLHDHPTALEFKYRLRKYILGKNDGSLSFGNTEEDHTPDLNLELGENVRSSELCSKLLTDRDLNNDQDHNMELADEDELIYDGLENLGGYICHRLKHVTLPQTTSTSTSASFTWTDQLSEGGLTKASPEIMEKLEKLEKIFQDINKDTLVITKNYLQYLIRESEHIHCHVDVKTLFFRSRMYFRIRQLNSNLQELEKSRKRKLDKIIH